MRFGGSQVPGFQGLRWRTSRSRSSRPFAPKSCVCRAIRPAPTPSSRRAPKRRASSRGRATTRSKTSLASSHSWNAPRRSTGAPQQGRNCGGEFGVCCLGVDQRLRAVEFRATSPASRTLIVVNDFPQLFVILSHKPDFGPSRAGRAARRCAPSVGPRRHRRPGSEGRRFFAGVQPGGRLGHVMGREASVPRAEPLRGALSCAPLGRRLRAPKTPCKTQKRRRAFRSTWLPSKPISQASPSFVDAARVITAVLHLSGRRILGRDA